MISIIKSISLKTAAMMLLVGSAISSNGQSYRTFAALQAPDAKVKTSVYEPASVAFDFIPFRWSQNMNDMDQNWKQKEAAIAVVQATVNWDVLQNNKTISLGPTLSARFSGAFVFHAGTEVGMGIGINDKSQHAFPVGVKVNAGYNLSGYYAGDDAVKGMGGVFAGANLIVKMNKDSRLRLGYNQCSTNIDKGSLVQSYSIGWEERF